MKQTQTKETPITRLEKIALFFLYLGILGIILSVIFFIEKNPTINWDGVTIILTIFSIIMGVILGALSQFTWNDTARIYFRKKCIWIMILLIGIIICGIIGIYFRNIPTDLIIFGQISLYLIGFGFSYLESHEKD